MNLKLWNNTLLPGITFVNNTYSNHSFPPHFHDHYVIMIVNKGVNEGICEKKKYQVSENDILFINPGEIHTGNSYRNNPLEYSAFYIPADFFTKELLQNSCNPTPVFPSLLKTNSRLVNEMKSLFLSTQGQDLPLKIEEQKETVFGALLHFAQLSKPEATAILSKAAVQKVKSYIKDQYKNQFSLASLTNYAGLSPFHLVRSFKEAVGITPFQFLRNYRVEKAKQELLKKRNIAQVALEVGFYDQSHFHKHFKLVTGVTPREFQRQQQ